MKRSIVVILLFMANLYSSAQTPFLKNEVRSNNLTIFYTGRVDLSYDRKLNPHFSTGIAAGAGVRKIDYTKYQFLVKSFARYFTGKTDNFSGFFLQGSLTLSQAENLPYSPGSNIFHKEGVFTFLGPAYGLGNKFLTSNKIPLEAYTERGPGLINRGLLIPIVYDAGICIDIRF